MAITSAKSSLLDVSFPDAQLVITGPQINLRVVARALKLVKEIINARKRITILDGHFVQLTMIYTHAKTSVLLLHKQNRSSPRGRTRSDETLFKEFLQLARQLLHLGRCKTIRSSGNRSCTWSKINTKLNLTMGRKTRQIIRKHIGKVTNHRNILDLLLIVSRNVNKCQNGRTTLPKVLSGFHSRNDTQRSTAFLPMNRKNLSISERDPNNLIETNDLRTIQR